LRITQLLVEQALAIEAELPETPKMGPLPMNTGGNTFSYNSQNQLVSMNNGAVQIVYDGFGNRVSKTVNGVTTKYLVEDDVNPTGYPQVFDELTSGAVTRTYTYGLQRIDEEQVVNNAWTTSYYGYDGFGTVRQLTNSAGAVTDTWEYDAFGNVLNHTGTTPNNYLYRGEQFDTDLGLYYLRARYYNPETGRFMSRDPLNGNIRIPITLHKYVYAGADSVNVEDPSGESLLDRLLAGILSVTLIAGNPEEQAAFPHVEIETEAMFQEAEHVLEEAVGGSAPPPPPPPQ
jgi:RHS repeat-associated protein